MKTTRAHKVEYTDAELTAQDAVIPAGHLAFDTVDGSFKVGDGVRPYTQLATFNPNPNP